MNELLKLTGIKWLDEVIKKANEITAILVINAVHNSRRHRGSTAAHKIQKVEIKDDSIRENNRSAS